MVNSNFSSFKRPYKHNTYTRIINNYLLYENFSFSCKRPYNHIWIFFCGVNVKHILAIYVFKKR